MKSTITGRRLEITPALKDHVNTQLERIMRHYEPPTSVQVVLTVDKLDHKAEGILQISGETVVAEAVDADMYTAIDALAAKLERQLRRHKEQRSEHHVLPSSRLPDSDLRAEGRKRA